MLMMIMIMIMIMMIVVVAVRKSKNSKIQEDFPGTPGGFASQSSASKSSLSITTALGVKPMSRREADLSESAFAGKLVQS